MFWFFFFVIYLYFFVSLFLLQVKYTTYKDGSIKNNKKNFLRTYKLLNYTLTYICIDFFKLYNSELKYFLSGSKVIENCVLVLIIFLPTK